MWHHVAQRVMAVNIHALLRVFNNGDIVREALAELLVRTVKAKASFDSYTFFKVIPKSSNIAQKRSQISKVAWRESYKQLEMKRIG